MKKEEMFSLKSPLSYYDKLSKEIADYHGEIVSLYLDSPGEKPTSFNEASSKKIIQI